MWARAIATVLAALFIVTALSLVAARRSRDAAIGFGAEAQAQAQNAQNALEEVRRQSVMVQQQEQKARDAVERALQEQGRAEREKANAEAAARIAEEQRLEAQSQRSEATRQSADAQAQRQLAETQRRLAEQQSVAAQGAQRQAETAAAEADRAKRDADSLRQEEQRLRYLSVARALAGEAVRQFDANALPVLLARQAYNSASSHRGDLESPEIATALRRSLENFAEGSVQVFLGHNDAVRAVAISPDGNRLATASDDGRVRLFNVHEPARPASVLAALGSPVRAIAFDATGRLLAAGTFDGVIQVWNLAQPPKLAKSWTGHTQSVSSLAFAADNNLVSIGFDGQVKRWRSDTFIAVDTIVSGKQLRLIATALNARRDRLAVATDGDGVLLVNLGAPSVQARTLAAGRRMSAVAFSPDDRWLAGGTAAGQLLYWDVAGSDARAEEVVAHRAAITSLQFAGDLLASASLDGEVKVWKASEEFLDKQPLVLNHGAWIWALAFGSGGDRVLSAGADGRVRSWPTRARALAEKACRRVGRDLTQAEWQLNVADLPFESTCSNPAGGSRQ